VTAMDSITGVPRTLPQCNQTPSQSSWGLPMVLTRWRVLVGHPNIGSSPRSIDILPVFFIRVALQIHTRTCTGRDLRLHIFTRNSYTTLGPVTLWVLGLKL